MNLFTNIFNLLILQALIFSSCQSASQNSKSSSEAKESSTSSQTFGYQLSEKESFTMPEELNEISGITFLNSSANELFAVQDEQGILFSYDLNSKKINTQVEFAEAGDYEDLVTDNSNFFILKSNGDIYSFPKQSASGKVNSIVQSDLVPKGEYESLSIDTAAKKLYVLCKECKVDKKANQTSGYILSYKQDGELTKEGEFAIDLNQFEQIDEKIAKRFRPSAMAQKVSTKEWFVVSSLEKSIVILDAQFKVKEVVPFTRKDFEQAEGIAFDNQENLFISSEAGDAGSGMIYKMNKIK